MKQIRKLYPEGKKKAFTMSYDDGVEFDVPLIEIMNQYQIKGTFNLNSGLWDGTNCWENSGVMIHRLAKEKLKSLYTGHEVAVHTVHHPHLEELCQEEIRKEILDDQENLQSLFQMPVQGMAYPFGTYNETVLSVLEQSSILYSREVGTTEQFGLPKNFLLWEGTAHHNNPRLKELTESFLQTDQELALYYVWGHSYEFETNHNWNVARDLCAWVTGRDEIWYATNLEICKYILAMRKVQIEHGCAVNLGTEKIWLSIEGETKTLDAGETLKF